MERPAEEIVIFVIVIKVMIINITFVKGFFLPCTYTSGLCDKGEGIFFLGFSLFQSSNLIIARPISEGRDQLGEAF